MSRVTVDTRAFEAGIAPAFSDLRHRVRDLVEHGADVWEREAFAHCPVHTGRLRSTIRRGEVLEEPGRVAVDLEAGRGTRYAWFVEAGTARHGHAQPFFRIGLDMAVGAMERLRLA